MSYIYKFLQYKNMKFVEESSLLNITVAQNNRWNLYDLIHKNADQLWNKQIFWTIELKSFQRTKVWLKENHPELIL